MEKIKANYKNLDRAFVRSLLVAVFLFAVSLTLNYFTSAYATSRAGAPFLILTRFLPTDQSYFGS